MVGLAAKAAAPLKKTLAPIVKATALELTKASPLRGGRPNFPLGRLR